MLAEKRRKQDNYFRRGKDPWRLVALPRPGGFVRRNLEVSGMNAVGPVTAKTL